MTDDHEAEDRHDGPPGLDPERDAHIRGLLAELGSGPDGEPLPPEIAARLFETLARLVDERARTTAEESSSTVVPLRRRWLPRALVAAAAVVVLGAGGVAVANLGLLGAGSSDSSASSADSAGGSEAKSLTGDTAGVPVPENPPLSDQASGLAAAPRISSGSFATQVRALLARDTALAPGARVPAAGSTTTSPGKQATSDGTPQPLGGNAACRGPSITDGGVSTLVRYDGRPAVLVVHPVHDGNRLVEAWACGGARRLATTTLTP